MRTVVLTRGANTVGREDLILANQPCLVEATYVKQFNRSILKNARTTYPTLSRRMISSTSRVPRSSRPALASPSRMLASMSKLSEVSPAFA